jgi:hypothetical protein
MRKKPNDKDPFFNNVKTDLENKGFKIHTIFES